MRQPHAGFLVAQPLVEAMGIGAPDVAGNFDQATATRHKMRFRVPHQCTPDAGTARGFVDHHHRNPPDLLGPVKNLHHRSRKTPDDAAMELGHEDGQARCPHFAQPVFEIGDGDRVAKLRHERFERGTIPRDRRPDRKPVYSHSIVPGGLLV